MDYTIQNDCLSITVTSKGAELQTLLYKPTGIDYMWSGDPAFWAKKSPVLFPIVGTLKDNTYFFNHKCYHLARHGFARNKDFLLKEQTDNRLLWGITSDDSTRNIYPFEFEFYIQYEINKATIRVTYIVKNTSHTTMFFSMGGHPAFKVPMFPGDAYEDYELIFDRKENAQRWPITQDGLLSTQPLPFLDNTDTIALHKGLFQKDAVVLKNLQSQTLKLISLKNKRGIEVDFHGFPYLGIWAAKNADFVCIEPWCGIADGEDSHQSIVTKEGINELPAECTFERAWSVTVI